MNRNLASFGLLICLGHTSVAAALCPETLDAWNSYLQRAQARDKAQFGLFSKETIFSPIALRALQEGQIFVRPASQPNPTPVPFGLVHDWKGIAFIPCATLEQVLLIVLDYDRYPMFYAPLIVESKTLRRNADQAEFSLVMRNRSLFSQAALMARYTEQILHLDANRVQTITQSVSIQEVENYGNAQQRVLSPEESSGYLWRIFSVAQFQQTSEGVVLQLEMIALSRDVPKVLRWVIDPVIRCVAESTLKVSLERTRKTVQSQGGKGAGNQ